MLNTVSTAYQANGAQPLYNSTVKTNTVQSNVTKNGAIDNISISDQAKTLSRIDEIDAALGQIFGTPKSLNLQEQQALNSLMMDMDKIYMKDKADEVANLYAQMDALYVDGVLSSEDQKTLSKLENSLTKLMQYSTYELNAQDEAALAQINAKIDTLYGTKEPSTLDLAKAESLMSEKEQYFASLFEFEQLTRFYQA